MRTRILRHLLLPSLAPALFCGVAATPVELLGCRNRGLAAVLIAFVSVIAGLGASIMAVRDRVRGERLGGWWAASALILAIPAVALLIIARAR
jgi:hypothetical protein